MCSAHGSNLHLHTRNLRYLAPGAVFYHGGGWALGKIQADDIFCRLISRGLSHVVVSVEYHLTPEHVFPAAIDDDYDAFIWIVKHASQVNIDEKKIYVTGSSAGSHISAAVALRASESAYGLRFAAQILPIPFVCDPLQFKGELPERSKVPIFNDAALATMLGVFAPDPATRSSCCLSPLLTKSDFLKKLPQMYIDVCTADPLCVPANAYGGVLEDHGVPVKIFALE
ncbi:uncharacterized protein PV09_03305 [Verruconis gallopava]|uniref:Alpha/beta hydrolase fold-3 domain-containing protein n=1 Tax=Verruconis gallopava TaxID=253628 RepID=A0A0D2AGU6_9PEZI|nr:uncharacterized protein PV09_03305 [Verruconis gallopava]KIW06143.1 hypothetical protein PV09_03305 [Verruconis gallopava]